MISIRDTNLVKVPNYGKMPTSLAQIVRSASAAMAAAAAHLLVECCNISMGTLGLAFHLLLLKLPDMLIHPRDLMK